MKKVLLLTALAVICMKNTFAQCIIFQNPGFEGTESDTIPPPDWTSCVQNYSATFPYPVDATLPPFSGNSYLGLRFFDNGGAITQGAVSQRMNIPFAGNGAAYTITVALADIANGNANNAQCQIYGGYTSCDTHELLWEDTAVIPVAAGNTAEWTQYTFTIHPSDADTFITIKVNSEVPAAGGSFWIGVDSLTITCNNATDIEQINTDNISIYPNPATNQVTINSEDNAAYSFMVYDLTGRKVITKEMAGKGTIDISRLSKGCYLAKILQGDKGYCQKLIIR